MKILKEEEVEFTKGYLEGSLKEALKRENLIGQPITDSLKAQIVRALSSQLQDLFGQEHEFGVDVINNNGQAQVNVNWDEKFDQKMKAEEKRKEVKGLKEKRERRKNQTTMEEDFINFLIG